MVRETEIEFGNYFEEIFTRVFSRNKDGGSFGML